MTDTPGFDQVAEARRRLATHAQFPTGYWVVHAVLLVAIAGIPIWLTFLGPAAGPYVSWALLASLAIAAIGFAGLYALVNRGELGTALVVLPIVAIAILVAQYLTRAAMRRDIENGRVRR
jgi:hypothetical protein